ncbi:MAG TPA: UDP-glucose/GDP-mannose dehydrogenase family protein [Phenylobacterium sp.]
MADQEPLSVSVFGAGYVGAVTAACIAKTGIKVVACDVDRNKVEQIGRGISPIVEPGLAEMLKGGVENGLITATTDAKAAVAQTNLSIVCVGTPSRPNGDLDLKYAVSAAEDIGAAIAQKADFHSVVVRSTMLPGSMYGTIIPALEQASGKKARGGFGIAYYPEFLREATAIADYENPSVIILGVEDERTLARLRQLNAHLNSPEMLVDITTSEAIKYANNCWHATKLTFANEIGNIAKACGIDGHKVMEAVCMDTRLNISTAYMKPGMAFGGSCLPKDLRALRAKGRAVNVQTPLLDGVSIANEVQIDRAFKLITQSGHKNIGFLGLSFKAGTDDLRESPLVEIAERLHGKGYGVRIFDQNVRYTDLNSNHSYIRTNLPHLADLMVDTLDELREHAQVLVVGNADPSFRDVMQTRRDDQVVVDLVRINQAARSNGQDYAGLCW